MVIRRVRDIAPPRETIPAAPRSVPDPRATEGSGRRREAAPPPAPDPKVREQGPEPPKETELSPAMEQELQEQKPGAAAAPEHGDNVGERRDRPAGGLVHRQRPGRVPRVGHLLGPQGGAAGDLHGHLQPRRRVTRRRRCRPRTWWRRGRSSLSASTGAAPSWSSTATTPAPSSPSTAPTGARSS